MDLHGGKGIEVVRNQNELDDLLSSDLWKGQRVMLSEFIRRTNFDGNNHQKIIPGPVDLT